MPSTTPFLISLRGTEEYARYLEQLRRAVAGGGIRGVDSFHRLAEHALAELGARYGLAPPRRMPGHGGDRTRMAAEAPPSRRRGE